MYHDIGVNQHQERKLICDVYCNNDNVDLCYVNALYDTWGDVRNRTHQLHPIKDLKKINRMVWRTLPLLDQQVGMLMVRDMDSEINSRELAAVQQWIQSNRTFHVMRDHQHHCDPRYKILGGNWIEISTFNLISILGSLAGLFGIKIHQQRDLIRDLTTIFISRSSKEAWGEDQKLLTEIFLPVVRRDAVN